MKKQTRRFRVAPVVAFDGACLKVKKSGGKWVCAPQRTATNPFPRHPKFTTKRR